MSGQTLLEVPNDLRRLDVQPLSEDELLAYVGGVGPILIGCALAAGGAVLAVAGVVIGVTVYYVLQEANP